MEHFTGVTPQERFYNDLLNEIRAIRNLLEAGRNAQTPSPEPKRTRKKVEKDDHCDLGQERKKVRRGKHVQTSTGKGGMNDGTDSEILG